MKPIKGSIVAMVTPFKEDESVDFERLEQTIEYQIKNGTDGILVLGTTGESTTMTHEEDDEVARFTIETVSYTHLREFILPIYKTDASHIRSSLSYLVIKVWVRCSIRRPS